MQEQGVRHDDPEYLKAHNLLSAVQRQQVYQKQRQLVQQQQQLQAQRQHQAAQQQQQPQQVNGIAAEAVSNGVDGDYFQKKQCPICE
jgi:ATP-dependent helicase STH1/SNF2